MLFPFSNYFSDSSSTPAKKSKPRNRRLQMESLEARQMLSVSPMELTANYQQYEDPYLPPNIADYKVAEIATAEVAANIAPAGMDDSVNLGPLTGIHIWNGLSLAEGEKSWIRFEIVSTGRPWNEMKLASEYISENNTDFYLYDALGREIDYSFHTVGLSNLPAGVYYACISGYQCAIPNFMLTISAPDCVPGSVTYQVADQTLYIDGTDGVDWIEIQETSTQIIVHSFDAGRTNEKTQSFAKNGITTIDFCGYGGDDTFINAYNGVVCSIDCRLNGVEGNNTLTGGSGNDWIYGGIGNNILDGGGGDNIVIGGYGNNTFYNNGNGSTAFAWVGSTANNQWAAGNSFGNNDALLVFSTTWNDGSTGGDYGPFLQPWTETKVIRVMKQLHRYYPVIGNYKILGNPWCEGVTYVTMSDVTMSDTGISLYSTNDGSGNIFLRRGFDASVHEFAHSWNYDCNPFWDIFMSISWNSYSSRKSDAVAADFTDSYAMTHPMEDWAQTVQYVVRGDQYSGRSEVFQQKVAVVYEFFNWLNPTTQLTTPTGVAATHKDATTVTVTWDAVPNASGYIVQYTYDPNQPDTYQTRNVLTTSADLPLTNPAYYFRVMAIGTGEYTNSDYSAWNFPPPVSPVGFTSPSQTEDSITLSWASYPTNQFRLLFNYTLEYKKSTESTWTAWTPAPGRYATGVTITGLAANTEYDFQLTAINTSGSASSMTTVKTKDATPVTAPTHRVFTPTSTINVPAGKTFTLDIKHELLNKEGDFGNSLGLKITYDTAYLTYVGYDSYLTMSVIGPPSESTPGTIIIGWSDFNPYPQWPGTVSPVDLIKAMKFTMKEGVEIGEFTTIQIEVNNPTPGFQVEAPADIVVNVVNGATLDINGDGNFTTADANLMLRYLFGYSGTDLTRMLLPTGSTRTDAVEIAEYLQTNRDVFDINGDGYFTTADANLLLRYLFGYQGNDLTRMLITSGSTRTTAGEIIEYIEGILPPIMMAGSSAYAEMFAASFAVFAEAAASPTQQITASVDVSSAKPGDTITLTAFHELLNMEYAQEPDCLTTGISLNITYDPAYVEYQPTGSTSLPINAQGIVHQPANHTLIIAWNDFTSYPQWPGTAAMLEIFKLNFVVKADAPEGNAVFTITANPATITPGFDVLMPGNIVVKIEHETIPYNLHDLQKVATAKAVNGLTDDHVIWGEVNGEMRLIGVVANDAGLTGVLDLAGCTQLWAIACDNNLLTALDLSGCTALLALACENNLLTALDLSGCPTLFEIACGGNNLKFSTLPLPGTLFEYRYASQGNVEIASSLKTTQTLDLSSESMIGGTATVYTWFYANGTPIEGGYTETAGKFVFSGLKDGDVIFCEMTNEKFPGLTLTTTEVTISAALVMPYDLSGDGRVDIHDLILFIQDYGKRGDDLVSDFNGDGVVNIHDLILFIQNYGWRAPVAGAQMEMAPALDMTPAEVAAMFGLVAEPEPLVEEMTEVVTTALPMNAEEEYAVPEEAQAAAVVPATESAVVDVVVYPRSDADHPALTGTPPEEGNTQVTVTQQFSAAETTATT